MSYFTRDSNFWRGAAGGGLGLALALTWLRFGFGGFLLALAFTLVGALAARFFASD